MAFIPADQTHYMTFPHTRSGSVRQDFTCVLLKNGALIQSIPINVQEVSPFKYTISFDNDGTDYSDWTLMASDNNITGRTYIETWQVRKLTPEKNISQIRSMQESSGGFFQSSTNPTDK